jgi:thioesterase domain-containing protein
VVRAPGLRVVLEAPLRPNVNHVGTVFGGTQVALQAVACWAFLERLLSALDAGGAVVVIEKCEHEFLAPVKGTFQVVCQELSPAAVVRLRRALFRGGRARVKVTAQIRSKRSGPLAAFKGHYYIRL